MGKIHPSPALIVTADTPISECVRKMRNQNVGSLLIFSSTQKPQLVGIFTERDLLKWVDEIQHGGHWEKPVSLLMSKPVQTIAIDELHRATEIMLAGKFRHLPVVGSGANGKRDLIGVISMRDLLAEQVRADASTPARSARKREKGGILLLTSPSSSNSLERMIRMDTKRSIARGTVDTSGEGNAANDAALTVMDLDGIEPAQWANTIRCWRGGAPSPLLVVFSPRLLLPAHVRLLKSIASPGKIEVFEKPFNVMGFLARVRVLAEIT